MQPLRDLFAIVASILTAPLLIARAVGLDSEATQYVISASLVVSGIATFIQTFRIGIVGSGLLAVQGTSFAFIGTMAYAASQLPPTTSQEELLGVLLGTAAVGGGMIVFLSFFRHGTQSDHSYRYWCNDMPFGPISVVVCLG